MKTLFDGKRIVLGVSGGIAAYKSVELLRLLMKAGARVRVAMTDNAKWFVGPGTFQALSGLPVLTSVFEEGDASIRHIDWAQEAELVVIAPATANFLGKLANGIADDALTTFMLAVTAPVVICPAMNTHMYAHPAVQKNRRWLESMGFSILEPDDGELACGTVGPGRLPNPERILAHIAGVLTPVDMKGIRLLVTAGPTQEYLDPVRFLSNPSSGKMGFAVATAAARRGADVHLVTGPVDLADPPGVAVERVVSAREMAGRVMALVPDAHIIVKAAAVSDYSPMDTADHKMKKGGHPDLESRPNRRYPQGNRKDQRKPGSRRVCCRNPDASGKCHGETEGQKPGFHRRQPDRPRRLRFQKQYQHGHLLLSGQPRGSAAHPGQTGSRPPYSRPSSRDIFHPQTVAHRFS